MALGPRSKSALELHWQHQLDHVRADLRNVYRRLQNETERAAFEVIRDHYNETGELLDLTADPKEIERLLRRSLPESVDE